MLSWLTAPGAGREYSLTRLRSAANTSLDPPTLVLPNVSDSPCARGASAAEVLRHTTAMKTPSGALGRARRGPTPTNRGRSARRQPPARCPFLRRIVLENTKRLPSGH